MDHNSYHIHLYTFVIFWVLKSYLHHHIIQKLIAQWKDYIDMLRKDCELSQQKEVWILWKGTIMTFIVPQSSLHTTQQPIA